MSTYCESEAKKNISVKKNPEIKFESYIANSH